MGVMCSYRLWVLGTEARHVVQQLVDDSWILVSQSEMGAEFRCEGKWLIRHAPSFDDHPSRIVADHPRLVVVMVAEHDANMGLNHLLHVGQGRHHTSQFWPPEPEYDEPVSGPFSEERIRDASNAAEDNFDDEDFMQLMQDSETEEAGKPYNF